MVAIPPPIRDRYMCPVHGVSSSPHYEACNVSPRVSPAVQNGWICPGCGRGYAPWVPMCHFCPAPEQPAFIGKAADDR